MSEHALETVPDEQRRLIRLIAAATYGGDVDGLLSRCMTHPVPGICVRCEDVLQDVDPDSGEDYCSECEANTVTSLLVLAEII